MKYNDQRNQKNKNILTGNAWYEIQAFRALNQALGRCIRHRRDWGAILMVDARYGQITRYVNSLSKWVRNGVQHHNNSQQVFDQLKMFREDMTELDQEYQAEFERLKALEPPPVPKLETTSSSKRGTKYCEIINFDLWSFKSSFHVKISVQNVIFCTDVKENERFMST